jgi:DNA-binding winged helix-turn-helix (wHTH) protein
MSAGVNQTLKAVPDSLEIGDWHFHVGAHELERNGETIRLEPRAASLLLYLATRAGEPISRAALLEALWPGVVVSDEALTNAVNKLRRAFGDERQHPRIIETIPKMGYRLIAEVSYPATADTQQEEVDKVLSADARLPEFRVQQSVTNFKWRSGIKLRTRWLVVGFVLSFGVLSVWVSRFSIQELQTAQTAVMAICGRCLTNHRWQCCRS